MASFFKQLDNQQSFLLALLFLANRCHSQSPKVAAGVLFIVFCGDLKEGWKGKKRAHSSFPNTVHWKDSILSPLNDLDTLLETYLMIYVRIYFCAHHWSMSVFKPVYTCFHYCNCVKDFKSRKCETTNTVLLNNCLVI